MRLVYAEPASRDLASIIAYIALDSPAAAETVIRRIIESAHKLTRFPDMGRMGRLPGTRELVVPGLPYLIVYQVTPDMVTVLAVFHGSRNLARALAERGKA
ncbi:hypothetical protein GCM10007301_13970 [Azorhizobium oxalatiphilum]|uniref:Type II toxin-antitoxin system RelE/ParE family toxin n=1 Tax=Azorhizobium oxalatiphilum TaxID=980631 RepID=A0A917BR05_9HYPH|nr:type II toxin-antitoxin system RelE/ParE family toxin [Azorhizobium oxalatiphilum]GGF55529.1 hypothetical protein GCM10007301_13970 [Azorhizobium oxalatiphilum]